MYYSNDYKYLSHYGTERRIDLDKFSTVLNKKCILVNTVRKTEHFVFSWASVRHFFRFKFYKTKRLSHVDSNCCIVGSKYKTLIMALSANGGHLRFDHLKNLEKHKKIKSPTTYESVEHFHNEAQKVRANLLEKKILIFLSYVDYYEFVMCKSSKYILENNNNRTIGKLYE